MDSKKRPAAVRGGASLLVLTPCVLGVRIHTWDPRWKRGLAFPGTPRIAYLLSGTCRDLQLGPLSSEAQGRWLRRLVKVAAACTQTPICRPQAGSLVQRRT